MSDQMTAALSQRRFDRSSWLTVAFVAGFAAICALVAGLVLREPGDGCLLDLNTIVYACVGDWPTPLQPGDRILSVAGLPLAESMLIRSEAERLTALAAAPMLPYTVHRGDDQLDLAVPIGRLGGWGILRAFQVGFLHYSLGWATYILLGATIIFLLAPRARAAHLLLVATATTTAVVTLVWTAESVGGNLLAPASLYATVIVLATFWGWLLLPTLLLLVLSFPRRVWPLARWPRATSVLLYLFPAAALATMLLTGQADWYFWSLGLGAVAFLAATVVITAQTFWRSNDAVVRAQAAWLSLGLLAGIGIWPLMFTLGLVAPALASDAPPAWIETAMQVGTSAVFAICLGVAITRYRLFDIEVIVNRALVYTLLTATLAAVYFGGVVLVQGLIRGLTGQESDLAIVASTLAVAVCFQPMRGRLQAFIDRRFFRRKYDARQVLASYGAALRDDRDLASLHAGLLRVTDETLRPAHLSLWLREPGER